MITPVANSMDLSVVGQSYRVRPTVVSNHHRPTKHLISTFYNMRSPLIITDHALLRTYENRLAVERVQQLWQSSRRCKDSLYRNQDKYAKYGEKQFGIEYFCAGGFLFTVDTRKNVLVTITPKSSKKVKF